MKGGTNHAGEKICRLKKQSSKKPKVCPRRFLRDMIAIFEFEYPALFRRYFLLVGFIFDRTNIDFRHGRNTLDAMAEDSLDEISPEARKRERKRIIRRVGRV